MKALVTGGGGYLGGALVRALLARGDEVVTLQRGDYPWLARSGVQVNRGDVSDHNAMVSASRECDVVFHVAGKTGVWGGGEEYYRVNVAGTESVINACLENGVRRLVYTSSPSVIFSGKDEEGVDESVPYPRHYYNNYQYSKAIAERKILAVNGDDLATVALRPHLIWGPDDPHLVGRLAERARSGKLKLVNRDNLVDCTYIDNAVSAHLQAAGKLAPGSICAGRAYFITNGEPLPMRTLINRILESMNLPPTGTISPTSAYLLGFLYETIYSAFGIKQEPLMTRFVARQLSCSHWYDISAAGRDLGYRPEVSIETGLEKLARMLHELAR